VREDTLGDSGFICDKGESSRRSRRRRKKQNAERRMQKEERRKKKEERRKKKEERSNQNKFITITCSFPSFKSVARAP
jgi:negative regulator of genetic competence, sporulation and motility